MPSLSPASGLTPNSTTAYRGQDRIIPIGPRGQEIIREWLKPDLYAFLFSPCETMEALRVQQRQQRKTKVQPSQQNRKKARPKRKPGKCYRVGSYAVAIARAGEKFGFLAEGWEPALSEELQAELDRRWANYQANPASGKSWEDVVAHVRRPRLSF